MVAYLPALLSEIAQITSIDDALKIAQAKGGVEATIASRLSPDNWLVEAVGIEKAQKISHHFTSGRGRIKLFIPLGSCGTYKKEQLNRLKAYENFVNMGLSAPQIARKMGVTERSVRNYIATKKHHKPSRQGELFGL